MELRQFYRLTWDASKKITAKLLQVIVVPLLRYAVPIWLEAIIRDWCIRKLRSIQQLILMSSIRSFKTISIKSTFILSNSTPLEMRANDENNHILSTILEKSCINPSTLDFSWKSAFTALSIEQNKYSFPISDSPSHP